jgi:NAD(P)-dependent dehydrogenase (short-subunit alcohol dehydrogenase family)
VSRRGGKGIAVACDHADDAAVAELFAQIKRESGRLDLLVNNATAIPDELVLPGGFWEKPLSMQAILDVGCRSHYVASWHAARMTLPPARGLIAMVSSRGRAVTCTGRPTGRARRASTRCPRTCGRT